ncbi:hypothetical protein FFLO_02630 [Filobasidium floriforme]|uniref:Protein CPL1-like domain-containing protein n=1 Tax=Filobasidium floriforme TaxID=5210 RepID=A0A8K0NR23_9TREE|nr:hypothetical protein FFLO_02630 [Filobasidium floriforme]
MFSFAKTLSIAALLATVLPSTSASPTPTLDTLDPNHVWGVDLSIPFWLCFEDDLVLSSVCKCVPYYGKVGGKRDVSEVVRSNGLEKRTLWIENKCVVPAKYRPDIIEWHGGCCDQACEAWCGNTCLMKGEVCVSGKPQKPATQTGHYDHYGSHVWKRDTGCAVGSEKCFVGGTMKNPLYECVNTSSDLEHCGGCATPDPFDFGNAANSTAQDCTAISHAASVGCNAGRCTVQSCDPGYVAVSDAAGDRCVRSQVEAIKLQKYRL